MALIDRLAVRRRQLRPGEIAVDETSEPAIPEPDLGADGAASNEDSDLPVATPVPRRREDAVRGPLSRDLADARTEIHARLVDRHADEIDITDREGVRRRIVSLAEQYLKEESFRVSRLDFVKLVEAVFDEVCGLGPLQPLLEDDTITEIMINHPGQVFVERRGRVTLSAVTFDGNRQLKQVIDRIVSTVGRRVDERSPMCDARLKDGSRGNAV